MNYWKNIQRVIIVMLGLVLLPGMMYGQFATIGGKIWEGRQLPDGSPNLNPGPGDEVFGAQVMVQNQHSEGAFITYGTVTGNTWTADVPAPGEYVVMFSAPGYDLTSREFTVQPGDNQTKDAFLPPLYKNLDGTPSTNELPLANLLVYAFYDFMVNGEPDGYPEDVPLNGVKFIVRNEDGDTLAVGYTGSQPVIQTSDGLVITNTDGLYYFTGLPPGEVIVTSDPSEVWTYPQLPEVAALGFDQNTEFYLNYTEEGGPAWDPKLYPGDPGTEAGGFLIWHSYVEKMGQIDASNVADRFPPGTTLANAGSISGTLVDADKPNLAPDEPFPIPGEDHPGVTLNDRVPDGLVILFTENAPVRPVATVEADPVTGDFTFNNVPPGRYKMMMFDIPLDYVWTQQQVTVAPNQNVVFPLNTLLVPRFFARVWGYVYDNSTNPPTPIPGAEVHIRYEDGSVQMTEYTDANGWYRFDDLPEIEVLGYVDVELPPGYRGAMRTETFYPGGRDTTHINYKLKPPIDVTFNAMNRYVQWYTANYQADLYVEPIPANEGLIKGFVYNDNLERGSWVGDGVYNKEEERTLFDVTVELWDATGTQLLATTKTGEFDDAATLAQGWFEPYTWPPDEFGGVFVGPFPGYYEFRGIAPGDYIVKIYPGDPLKGLAGFSASPAGSESVLVTVTGGSWVEQDFGVNTTPPGASFGVPLAGEIEGGIFDDVNIDTRGGSLTADPNDLQSLLFMEKAGVVGAPVGIYDHLGYLLGVGYMGNPLCYAGSPDIPGQAGVNQCPPGQNPIQKPEMERRTAPGVHIYVGNDPNQPGYNPNYLPLTLPYTFGQGKFKFEADWSLVPVAFMGLGAGMLGNGPIVPQDNPVILSAAPIGMLDENFFKVQRASYNPANPLENSPRNIQPSSGILQVNRGDIVRIYGQYFGDQQGYSTVSLGGQEQDIVNWTDSYVDVQIKPDALNGTLILANSTGVSNAIPVVVNMSNSEVMDWLQRSVYVWADNLGPEDGSVLHPYRTITTALNNLPSVRPCYVYVLPGTYHERIQITEDDVHLIGYGPHDVTLTGLPETSPTGDIRLIREQGVNGYGPTIFIGAGGETGSVSNITISGFTITGGTVDEDIGCGIFGDYGNTNLDINNCLIYRNGGYYGGGIWLHKSNHDVKIWSNIIAENGNYGGYGGGISVNDEPGYGPEHGQPEHIWDDSLAGPPPGTYEIHNNLIFHNYSPDYGGGICLYEVKDHLKIYGNIIVENHAEDHGGGMYFEETGPIDIYGNVILRNLNFDDGAGISFEDVGDTLSHINVYNNVIAQNISDDHGENAARGAGIAFDDAFYARVFNNTIVGNIVAGSFDPAGGGMDSERNGHEYNGQDGPFIPPGYSDPEIFNNIIWNNWRLNYDQPLEGGEEEDLPYTHGLNYQWTEEQLHVDNPAINGEWETDQNSESFTHVEHNDIQGGYSNGVGNLNIDPQFLDPDHFRWHLSPGSPVINQAPAANSPSLDLDQRQRQRNDGMVDMGAYEYQNFLEIIRLPQGILGVIKYPTPGLPNPWND